MCTIECWSFLDLGERVEEGVGNVHLGQGVAVDGHGGLEDLVGAVAAVLDVPPRGLAEAAVGHAGHREPPLVVAAVERPPERRGAVAVRRADALVHVPELGVPESLQDFLEAEPCQSVSQEMLVVLSEEMGMLDSRGACCLASEVPAG